LRVVFTGSKEAVPVVARSRLSGAARREQAQDDLMLVYQDRRVLPEMLILVLAAQGSLRNPQDFELGERPEDDAPQRRVGCEEGVEVPAKTLLDLDDVGAIPWLPLHSLTAHRRICYKSADGASMSSAVSRSR